MKIRMNLATFYAPLAVSLISLCAVAPCAAAQEFKVVQVGFMHSRDSRPRGRARELIRFIPSHSFIPAERVSEQYRAVMSEIPLGKGRLWICDLAIADSIDIDPVARIFADNLYRAAADPESATKLPNVPSHQELLKGAD